MRLYRKNRRVSFYYCKQLDFVSRRCIEFGSKEGKFEVRENTLRFSSGITLGTIHHWCYPLKSKDGNGNETYLALVDLKNSMISALSRF